MRVLWPLLVPLLVAAAPSDPLHSVLRLAGRRDDGGPILLPHETAHHLVTRVPVVDDLLLHPLAAAPSAEESRLAFDAAQDDAALQRALERWSVWTAPASTSGATATATGARPSPSAILDTAEGRLRTSHLPPALVESLLRLCRALEEADRKARIAFPPGPSGLGRHPEEFFLDRDSGRSRWLAHPTGVQVELSARTAELDGRVMDHAAWALAMAAQAEAPLWQRLARKLPESNGPLLVLDTNLGAVVVGSRGPDAWVDDAALIIDPGGDDRWTNNAGANRGVPARAALALDVAGDDAYEASGAHAQGAGVGGVGVLVDVGRGRDGYRGTRVVQGAGFFGAGLLVDDGGNDRYAAEAMAQGAAAFGTGVLLDRRGDDQMAAQARAQGFGATMGLGALLDLAGSDQRTIGVPGENPNGPQGGFGQGAGMGTRPVPWQGQSVVGGGVGLLYDRTGNDRYEARSHAQGLGLVEGLGLLLDSAGADTYSVDLAGQGAGLHGGIGLVIDGRGKDRWTAGEDAQGAAVDRALGVAWDRGSDDDLWVLRESSGRGRGRGGQGYARHPGALGILVEEGGNDQFDAVGMARGDALPPARPGHEPLGVFLDLGGRDQHRLVIRPPGVNPVDGAFWRGGEGIGQDGEGLSVQWPGARSRPSEFAAFVADGRWLAEALVGRADQRQMVDRFDTLWREAVIASAASVPSPAAAATPAPALPALDPELDRLSRGDPSLPVRRAAARLLVAQGRREGIDRLVESLASLSEDAPGRGGPGTLQSWLSVATGLDPAPGVDAWILAWGEHRDRWDGALRWPALAALERAALAFRACESEGVLAEASLARDLLPGDPWVEARAFSMVIQEAEDLIHEESQRWNPPLAGRLAEAASTWAPDDVRPFLVLARAFLQERRTDLAAHALDAAAQLDPDHPVLQALRLRLPKEDDATPRSRRP